MWTSDSTYLRATEGWLCLTIVLDLFSREMVGRSLTLTQGSFDNSQYPLQDALERIIGGKLKRPRTPLDD